jgi:hypothetical protein
MAACKKQLEEKPFSFLTLANHYKTATDAQTAINGVFSAMQAQAHYQRTVWLIGELPADNLIGNTTAERAELNNFKWTPANAEIINWWRSSYSMINRANDVIKYVPNISMDVTMRNHIVGNARFLRALGYFDLVRNFGDVPLLLNPITSAGDTSLFPSRTPAPEVYNAIIEDLKFAEVNCLTETRITSSFSSLKGMVSSGAATTLLAKVYLQRASTGYADAQDNQNALAALNKVIASKEYQLASKYEEVFDNAKKNGKEHIFSIQFGPVTTGITSNIILRMFLPSQLGGAGAFFVNNRFFQNGYSVADSIRRNWNMANKVGATNVTPFVYKYRDPSYQVGSNNSNVNWIVLRYADVLLMQSEALNNISPADPAKFAGVDSVRSRAGLKDVLTQHLNFTNTPTPDAFTDSLVKDRARELFIEGHRKYDLIRLKRYKQVMAAIGITVPDYRFLLPLPQTERDVNKNLGQNDGYPK